MPRVNNLPLDQQVLASDKFLISDGGTGMPTKLMTLDQLTAYLAKTGRGEAGKDTYIYEVKDSASNDDGSAYFGSTKNIAASAVNELTLSSKDINHIERLGIFQELDFSSIKISVADQNRDTNWAIYDVSSVVDIANEGFRLTLNFSTGSTNAQFPDGANIAITSFAHGETNEISGAQIRNGAGPPTDSVLARPGDFYIDTTNIELYGPYSAGSWGEGVDLVGVPNVGTITTNHTDEGTNADVEITKNGTSYNFVFDIPQGWQGESVQSFSSDSPGAGNDTTVTVTLVNPADGDSTRTETFTVAPGAQGYQGVSVTSSSSNVDDVALGGDTTVTLTLTDPSDNSTTTTTFDVKAGQKGEPFLDVEEGSTTVSGATTLRVVGTGVSLAADGDDPNTAVLTFHGGGGGITDPVFNALTYSGFTQDQFPNVNQTVTTNQTLTANDATITSVQFVSTNNDADNFDVTDSTSPYSSGAQTMRAGATNGSSVTVTSTITYNLPGDDSTTATKTHTFTPQRTTKPGREAFLSSPSSFNYTPAGNKIEAYDAGSFTVKSDYDTTDNNGWDVGTISYNHTVSSNSVSVTSGTSDFDFNATATITQASTPDTSGGDDDKISETGYQVNNDSTYDRIRSVRIGGTTNSTFTATEIQTLSSWGTDLKFRTESPNGQTFTISTTAGERIYILYDASLGDITKIVDGNNNTVTNQYTKGTDVSGMKFYLQDTAGAALTDYELTITL